ncbi:hypothetical protein C8F01DRAFT_1085589 [Mycena amicta]|nr:hypothetical protein C8F01DRAFT_1085589 [Mycena amicta]
MGWESGVGDDFGDDSCMLTFWHSVKEGFERLSLAMVIRFQHNTTAEENLLTCVQLPATIVGDLSVKPTADNDLKYRAHCLQPLEKERKDRQQIRRIRGARAQGSDREHSTSEPANVLIWHGTPTELMFDIILGLLRVNVEWTASIWTTNGILAHNGRRIIVGRRMEPANQYQRLKSTLERKALAFKRFFHFVCRAPSTCESSMQTATLSIQQRDRMPLPTPSPSPEPQRSPSRSSSPPTIAPKSKSGVKQRRRRNVTVPDSSSESSESEKREVKRMRSNAEVGKSQSRRPKAEWENREGSPAWQSQSPVEQHPHLVLDVITPMGKVHRNCVVTLVGSRRVGSMALSYNERL